jgi:hypothetical protein
MVIKMLTKTEKEKLAFIDAAQDATDDVVEPIIEEHMKAYREQFGSFSRVDCHLWDNVCISFVMAFQSALIRNVEEG